MKKFERKLVLTDADAWHNAVIWAIERNVNTPETQLLYLLLGDYGEADTLRIQRDMFDELSFDFFLIKDDKCIMNGGIILHGRDSDSPEWSIHT